MKNGKATGMDGIPVELWMCLGEEVIDMLCNVMQGIYEHDASDIRATEIIISGVEI